MQPIKVALVGRPNSGKTTLFNKLAKENQAVGNWSGVTVESKKSNYSYKNQSIEIVDLPGVHSLVSSIGVSIDEKITQEYIISNKADVYISVIDVNNLHCDLYVALQLLEQTTKPVILAFNKVDDLTTFNVDIFEQYINSKIIVIEQCLREGLDELNEIVLDLASTSSTNTFYPKYLNKHLEVYSVDLKKSIDGISKTGVIIRLLEKDVALQKMFWDRILLDHKFKETISDDSIVDMSVAKARHDFIKNILQNLHQQQQTKNFKKPKVDKKIISDNLDKLFLHRIFGLPLFLLIMYFMFVFSINIGGAFQDFFDLSSQALFIEGIRNIAAALNLPNILTVILADGIGRGLNVTVSFIPVLFAMFLFLSFLEGSGYISRASFLMDRFMRLLGLPGKAFLPMIVGFGCNVPAVMSTRTLEKKDDRILTIIMTPFMSCSARLAIYTVFVAAFFPTSGQNIIFALYLIGIFVAVFTGFLLRKTILKGEESSLIMELPRYQLPPIKPLLRQSTFKLKKFLTKATKLIVPFCIIIGAMGSVKDNNSDYFLLDKLGKSLTPIFKPMGITEDNWPATVGLLSGMVAKEVMVGTLSSLYIQEHKASGSSDESINKAEKSTSVSDLLREAAYSVPENLAKIKASLFNPIFSSSPELSVGDSVLGIMYTKFNGPIAAFSYLLFILLYFPCISVVVAIARELNKAWAMFSVLWSTSFAYVTATLFYQIATFMYHPLESIMWVLLMSIICFLTFSIMLNYMKKETNNIKSRIAPVKIVLTDGS